MRQILLFITLTGSLFLTNQAYACHCEVDVNSKVYQVFEKHWWGSKRAWTCNYSCYRTDSSTPIEVIGSGRKLTMGEDRGDEGVCDGLIYESRLNPYTLWEDITLVGQEKILPNSSKIQSHELKTWFKENCQ